MLFYFAWGCLLALSIIDAVLIIKPKTRENGILLLIAGVIIAIASKTSYEIKNNNAKWLRFFCMDHCFVLIIIVLIIICCVLGLYMFFDFHSGMFTQKTVKTVNDLAKFTGIFLLFTEAFLISTSLNVGKSIQNQITYTARNIPVTRYRLKSNEDSARVELLTSDGKQMTITDNGDVLNKNRIKIKRSLKYTKPKLVLTKYTAKNIDWLKKIHAKSNEDVTFYYYVVTCHEPINGARNNS